MKSMNKKNKSVLRQSVESFLEIVKSSNCDSDDITITIDAVEGILNDWEQTILSELDIIASENVKLEDENKSEESDSV